MISTPQSIHKLRTLGHWVNVATDARAAGRTVALANGVFDLFHVGHLRYLEAAAKEADLLVVAVNSDASTRALKGPPRPLIPDRERAEIVAGLGCVDGVLIFEATDVRAVLSALRPEVHAKGTDYTADTVPEVYLCRSWGGPLPTSSSPKTHATTYLLTRLGLLPAPYRQ